MRALILVAAAALSVSACAKNEAAENTMNVDEALTTENVMENDTMGMDAAMNADSNMVADTGVTNEVAPANAM